MRKNYILSMVGAVLLSTCFVNAVSVAKKVAYVTLQKNMDATAATVQTDPVYLTLNADPNLQVTLKVLATTSEAITDLADYDVIVVQESNGGGDANLKPAGSLALKSIPKPFIYNKVYALQKTRALSSTTSAAAGKEADGTANASLTITVEASALTHDLFKACTFENSNQIKLFNALTNDAGVIAGADGKSVKALNYNSGVTVTGGTLLAQPSTLVSGFPCTIGINTIPAGTTFEGTETTMANAIFVGMNFGAICANNGTNITSDCLTIWRNAVYILAGLTVPSTKATLPTTAVNDIKANSRVVSEKFYTPNGVQVKNPTKGLFIRKSTLENGASVSEKVVLFNEVVK